MREFFWIFSKCLQSRLIAFNGVEVVVGGIAFGLPYLTGVFSGIPRGGSVQQFSKLLPLCVSSASTLALIRMFNRTRPSSLERGSNGSSLTPPPFRGLNIGEGEQLRWWLEAYTDVG